MNGDILWFTPTPLVLVFRNSRRKDALVRLPNINQRAGSGAWVRAVDLVNTVIFCVVVERPRFLNCEWAVPDDMKELQIVLHFSFSLQVSWFA